MKEPIQGFDAPQQLPQMASEAELSVAELIFQAPGWDPMFAPELLHLLRNHQAIRSALGFCLELANQQQQIVNTAEDSTQIYRAQGALRVLHQQFHTLMADLASVDKGKETTQ